MAATRAVVYGLSTEGYSAACRMAAAGADVRIIDETTPSAITLNAEIARTYPDVASLKEDEPLLSMEPIDDAISRAQYLFFTPRIRRADQDTKTEIHSKFKGAVSPLGRRSSVVFCLPTGFGGNGENISVLEHVTGLKPGRQISYFYYPLEAPDRRPATIGSIGGREDPKLAGLLDPGGGAPRFVAMPSSEHFHAMDVLGRFSATSGVLEVCRHAQDEATRADLASADLRDMFLDDMAGGLFDLRSLGSSFEGANTMTYLINGSTKGIDAYMKRLIDEIRHTLKRNELKASRTKIALSWTLDRHSMRGDRIEMLRTLTARLRDYIGDVEAYEDPNQDLFHTDKTTVVVACSRADYEHIERTRQDSKMIVIKANPLCEIIR